MQKVLKFIKDYWITACIYLAMFLGYKYIADNQLFGGYLFPSVSKVAGSFQDNIGTLFLNMFYSFQLMIPAIVIAAAIAIVGGTILGMHKKIRKVVYPVEKMFQVILPAAMPSIMSGFINSLRGSFVVLVYAEMYGAKYGMGYYVKKFAEYGLYSEAWSGFIFMVVVLVIVMQLFEKVKNRILRWTLN